MSRGSGGRFSRSDRAHDEASRRLLDSERVAGQLLHRRTVPRRLGTRVAQFLRQSYSEGAQAHVYADRELLQQFVRRGSPSDFARFRWSPKTGSGAEWG